MEEIWRDIPGYEGLYQVSSEGQVRSFKRGKEWRILSRQWWGRYHLYKHNKRRSYYPITLYYLSITELPENWTNGCDVNDNH